ncbi:MAG TPA: response regulator, partial [Polyangiaceae bacterium LLY-WYZ-15_(1-7)]|nr:response regulator [Polyangiaceae bacterium LLY-WYZ-15_(1-7)]
MSEEARVLVVEDEAPIRDGLVALFEGQGFAATAVGDGPAALEQVAVGGWDLVLLDWMIPGVEGIEVLRRLRAQGDDTPVLLRADGQLPRRPLGCGVASVPVSFLGGGRASWDYEFDGSASD